MSTSGFGMSFRNTVTCQRWIPKGLDLEQDMFFVVVAGSLVPNAYVLLSERIQPIRFIVVVVWDLEWSGLRKGFNNWSVLFVLLDLSHLRLRPAVHRVVPTVPLHFPVRFPYVLWNWSIFAMRRYCSPPRTFDFQYFRDCFLIL